MTNINFWEYLFCSGARKMACNLYKRGVSDLKAHLDYCEDPARILIFLPKQKCSID